MRMDPDDPWSATDVVNGYPEAELAHLLAAYGDERYARRIARAIVEARPIESTAELAGIVRRRHPCAGPPARWPPGQAHVPGHPHRGQPRARGAARARSTRPSSRPGRAAVSWSLAYHSGEDRIVKDRFRHAATGGCTCPPGLPCVCGAVATVRLIRSGAAKPTPIEVAANRRAASARLRAVEKLASGQ